MGINVADLARARAYYVELMPVLGFEPLIAADDQFAYRPAAGKPGTYIFFYPAIEEAGYSRHRPGLQHLAFILNTRAEVQRAHEWARTHGCEVIHAPQEFPQYHPGYYATFWLDPEGIMLEAVCHRERETAAGTLS